jgi:hypothetical protein
MYTSYRFDRHSVSWALSEEGSFLAAITLVNPIWPPSTFSCVRCHISFYTLGTVSVSSIITRLFGSESAGLKVPPPLPPLIYNPETLNHPPVLARKSVRLSI